MIRSSALLTVAAMAMLVAGVFSASLGLIYASIAVSILAALTLGVGVLLRRRELFGEAAAGDIRPGWAAAEVAGARSAGIRAGQDPCRRAQADRCSADRCRAARRCRAGGRRPGASRPRWQRTQWQRRPWREGWRRRRKTAEGGVRRGLRFRPVAGVDSGQGRLGDRPSRRRALGGPRGRPRPFRAARLRDRASDQRPGGPWPRPA